MLISEIFGSGQNLGVHKVCYPDFFWGITEMDVGISMETTFDDGTKRTHQLGRLSRPYRLTQKEGLGLLLEDAKAILGQIQKTVLSDQVEEVCSVNRSCPDCGCRRIIHDYRERVFATVFGRFRHRSPRLRRCKCDDCSGVLSPVAHFFPDRATPELRRLQTELGSRHSFREAARITELFLPCAKQMNTTIRNRLGQIAHEIGGPKRNGCGWRCDIAAADRFSGRGAYPMSA